MIRVMDIAPIIPKNKVGRYDASEQWTPFTLKVHDPGVLRMITTVIVEASSIITAPGEKAPPLVPVPALIFETSPEAQRRKRSFMWLSSGIKLTYPGKIEYVGSYIDETTRNPMFLYEVLSTDKKGE
jgi:hypothetical protein